jgi:hypothetical protein
LWRRIDLMAVELLRNYQRSLDHRYALLQSNLTLGLTGTRSEAN